MPPYRILLVDDHDLFREGLASILSAQPDILIVGSARDGLEALVKAGELRPDLILMDVEMPGMDGLETTRQIKDSLPETRIIMLTVRSEDEKLFTALKNGAEGYLLKDIRSQELLEQLHRAMQGEPALAPHLAGRVLEEFRRLSQQAPAHQPPPEEALSLTTREQEVLALVAQGANNQEIADALHVSLHTVKSHIRNILTKLQVSSRREAAWLAKYKGLV